MAGVFPSNDYANRAIWRAYLPHALRMLGSGQEGSVQDRSELCLSVGLGSGWQDQRGSEMARRILSVGKGAGLGRLRSAVCAARARRSIPSRRTGAEGSGDARTCGYYRS
jgi:hypothetical protein